jgi:hypothetical protein
LKRAIVSVAILFDQRIQTPTRIKAWLTSGVLQIWLLDGKEFFSAPLYKIPCAPLAFMFPVALAQADLDFWESPASTKVVFGFDDGSHYIADRYGTWRDLQ